MPPPLNAHAPNRARSRALTPPHYFPEWHVGVRLSTGKRRLVACITGVPAAIEVYGRLRHVCEINYLCVAGWRSPGDGTRFS